MCTLSNVAIVEKSEYKYWQSFNQYPTFWSHPISQCGPLRIRISSLMETNSNQIWIKYGLLYLSLPSKRFFVKKALPTLFICACTSKSSTRNFVSLTKSFRFAAAVCLVVSCLRLPISRTNSQPRQVFFSMDV